MTNAVAFAYETPPQLGALRQGEILAGIYEYRPRIPAMQQTVSTTVDVLPIRHPRMIVMTADCDLDWDFKARFPDHHVIECCVDEVLLQQEALPAIIPHILLCEVYESANVRARVPASDLWKRIRQNQDERYHYFHTAPIGKPSTGELSDICLDFKKTLALPTQSLYNGISARGITRVALVPPIYIHDLMHRFYGFLSRVGLP
jgi:hypothetical protein